MLDGSIACTRNLHVSIRQLMGGLLLFFFGFFFVLLLHKLSLQPISPMVSTVTLQCEPHLILSIPPSKCAWLQDSLPSCQHKNLRNGFKSHFIPVILTIMIISFGSLSLSFGLKGLWADDIPLPSPSHLIQRVHGKVHMIKHCTESGEGAKRHSAGQSAKTICCGLVPML